MMTREQLPTLFDQFRKLYDSTCFITLPEMTQSETNGLSLYEDDDRLYLEAAVPGIKSEEIQVSIEKGVVWIKGEKQEELKNVKVHFHASKSYSYRVPLPVRIDDQVAPEAVCKDGILKVSFPKSRSAKPMKICVKCA